MAAAKFVVSRAMVVIPCLKGLTGVNANVHVGMVLARLSRLRYETIYFCKCNDVVVGALLENRDWRLLRMV